MRALAFLVTLAIESSLPFEKRHSDRRLCGREPKRKDGKGKTENKDRGGR